METNNQNRNQNQNGVQPAQGQMKIDFPLVEELIQEAMRRRTLKASFRLNMSTQNALNLLASHYARVVMERHLEPRFDEYIQKLQKEIDEFLRSTEMGGENLEMGGENAKRGEKTRDVILRIIRENPQITMAALAEKAGISAKAIEKQIARLKKDSLLVRVGPDKGGHWEVL